MANKKTGKQDLDLFLSNFKPKKETLRNSAELNSYWMGLTDDCPVGSIQVGHFDLVKFMLTRVGNAMDDTQEDLKTMGKILTLTDEEVKKSLELLEYAVLRPVYDKKTGELVTCTYRNLHPRARVNKLRDLALETDIPVAQYVWIKKLPKGDTKLRMYGAECPKTLLDPEPRGKIFEEEHEVCEF